ncbi:hypothetical protein B0I72DRAFT_164986 [Yarrowia lipolytica]|jgi:hypothetical protein|uniref:YALI0E06787p n=2 Tax=Yarrowia lipolytica TaxID=4952 RepID=Q6C6S0_YARLI|nr:YALI0E06787p [Yarrowia lipolytica CLIB122]AOW05055.1 hypothetical protein YALI1_E08157g [Yarrowia lipolytica]KAB8286132.1 hypothetical protein BKA91DRAFT_162076 [Yarrowia lipolytica]KAE8171396.1 hypothetical protein BKA90DRAFT_157877 [Yarrowia lipolytica]KAJ8056618.1 hypothetical protein LXG23DRAFT_46099 [Yarrowia lipolytica]RDW27801.1 hypothetical protein B0I71DRAFT_168902 [Yarrowia lipolytica]|eukprot:XP_503642.1 YALI0E06787p [Yarrowia lipolytica CLIB122]
MKFSIAALALVASALAQDYSGYNHYDGDNSDDLYSTQYVDESNYQWPDSDYVYQMNAQRDSDHRNLAMQTDGRHLYFGNSNRDINGTPLKTVNVFVDIQGDINIVHNHNSTGRRQNYVGVDDGRLALSDRRSNAIGYQRFNNNNRVAWQHDNGKQQFLACPVDSYGNAYDISYDQRSSDHTYQVFTGASPCANPISVSLNGDRLNGRAQYQNSRLRVHGDQWNNQRVVNNNGRLMISNDQRNDPFLAQLSYRGQMVDPNTGRFVQLGNQASMQWTDRNQVGHGLTGFNVNHQSDNRLTYENQGFLACQLDDGHWELRPVAVEAAAAACSNARYVQISMDPVN